MTALMETCLENRWLVQPNHANSLQTTHGGNLLKWMDELGVLSAMRFAGENCVTARMDKVNFERPIHVGDAALVRAYVFETGTTSVRVRLEAFREDPRTGERVPTTSSYSVYVAVDDDGEPIPVPELSVDSERGRELHRTALADLEDR